MRLIDADALNEAMYRKSFETDDGRQRWDGGLWIRYKVFEEARDEATTVDAVPVRHGKWIDKSGGIEGAWNCCSVCGERAIELYDYCPNCGAKMEADDETD